MMRALTTTLAAMLAATPVIAEDVDFDTFRIGQSAASIEKARNDRSAGIRTQLGEARAAGNLTGPIDPYFSTGIGQIRTLGGFQFTIGNVKVLATCRERGMRIYAIMQKREFRAVTADDVMPALKTKFGAAPKVVRLAQRPGSTAIDRWVLWDGFPAGMDGDMVDAWGHMDNMTAIGVSLPPGLAAHVQYALARTDVQLTRYSPEIAADAEQCRADAQAASRKAAVDAVRF